MFEGMTITPKQYTLPLLSDTEALIEQLAAEALAAIKKMTHEAIVFSSRSAGQRIRYTRERIEALQAEHAEGVRTGRYYPRRRFSVVRHLSRMQDRYSQWSGKQLAAMSRQKVPPTVFNILPRFST